MNLLNKVLYTLAILALPFVSSAQSTEDESPVANWQNLDLKSDGVFGISTEKAYKDIIKGKKSSPIVVAVIDGGIDIEEL